MKDLILVVPVYNEEGAIEAVVRSWYDTCERLEIDFEIRLYNDGSRDQTGAVLQKLHGVLPRIRVISKANSGHGSTILTGYREAVTECEWVFQTDSDGELLPNGFGQLWSARNDYDFLLGTRSGREGPLARRAISLISRLTVWACYGRSVWDVNSPYRLMRSRKFAPLFAVLPQASFAPNLLVSGFVAKARLRFLELPVQYRPRSTGEVSIRKWKLLKAALKSFAQTVQFQTRMPGG
jgi:glycosyltransferase involved in cell wall biosynthesis